MQFPKKNQPKIARRFEKIIIGPFFFFFFNFQEFCKRQDRGNNLMDDLVLRTKESFQNFVFLLCLT